MAALRDRVKELRRVRARDLVPNPRNWRRHGTQQTAALKAILSEIGFAGALLAREVDDGTLVLIDGHLRAGVTGDEQVPVLVLDVNEQEANRLLVSFDPIASMADADADTLKLLMAEWQPDNPAIQALFEHAAKEYDFLLNPPPELQDPPALIDKAKELRKKFGVETGQLWQIGEQRLLCGDSTQKADVERLFGGKQPELMVTDPPYGVNYDPTLRDGRGGFGVPAVNTGKVTNDDRANWSPAFQLSRCAVIYAWHPALHILEAAAALVTADYHIRAQIIWMKSHFAFSRGDYHWQHEPCFYAVRKNAKSGWAGDRTQSTFWNIAGLNPAGGHREGVDAPSGHGTQKPVECMARPIRNHIFKTVYDPFCGSGTTLVAAHQLDRIGFGCEIDPGYVAVTLERLSTLGLEPKLL